MKPLIVHIPIKSFMKNTVKNSKMKKKQQSKRKKDSRILRESEGISQIGSNVQREHLPFTKLNDDNDFILDEKQNFCPICRSKFVTRAALVNHIEIYVKKKHLKFIPVNTFDSVKRMTIVCSVKNCCNNYSRSLHTKRHS